MTVDAIRQPRRRNPRAGAAADPTIAPAASFVIGEMEQTVFECPSCSRPLALGARRCPGCRVVLVHGVMLGKAAIFISVGLAAGLLVGAAGGLVVGVNAAGAPPPVAAGPAAGNGSTVPNASAAPVASIAPTVSTVPTTAGPGDLPPATRSALIQIVATNDRLAAAGVALGDVLGARTFDASAAAQVLRTISADSVFGAQVAGRVATSAQTSELGAELSGFYGAIHDTAATGLVASVRNAAVYRAASRDMVRVLGGMAGLDDAVRSTAASFGLDLPTAAGHSAP